MNIERTITIRICAEVNAENHAAADERVFLENILHKATADALSAFHKTPLREVCFRLDVKPLSLTNNE